MKYKCSSQYFRVILLKSSNIYTLKEVVCSSLQLYEIDCMYFFNKKILIVYKLKKKKMKK